MIRPTILQNPGMDTFCPTEPVCPREDTLILLKLQNQAKVSYFGSIELAIPAFLMIATIRHGCRVFNTKKILSSSHLFSCSATPVVGKFQNVA